MAWKFLNSSPLPLSFWSYAYSCATHIHHQLPNRRTAPLSPMERLFSPAQMYPFEAEAIVHVPNEKRGKLDQKGISCRMLTFTHSGNGCIFYDPAARHIFQASSAVFLEYQALPRLLTSRKGKLEYIIKNLHLGKVPISEITEEQDKAVRHLLVTSDIQIPKTLKHTLSSPFASYWCNAVMV
ncbi:hypothetical protein O181_105270 [Austropuccinia psidii MF-1]|uniref:Retroviral polymerase SH3-like domain-containing protein n=1 Tax=Austropuccinia psidii MF-1 TaxID=1389203 RepID=A0A9Q3JQ56_9BASI|nr:hypothetical protein [Austropuccinia psidii MF-1]